jgi:hypothetical protein
VTTKRERRAWVIGLSVFAALLALGIAVDVFNAPTSATRTASAAATPRPDPAAPSCHRQVTGWQASAGHTYVRKATADAARVARLARAHQEAALRRGGAGLAAAVRQAAAHSLPSCLDTHGYYRAALADLSAAARAAARGNGNAVLRWVRAARQLMAKAEHELAPAHRTQHRTAARPASPSSAAGATPGRAATPRPGATAGRCYPLNHAGRCYAPGEPCPDSDLGVAGIAGDGQTIVCEDVHGLRWVPTGRAGRGTAQRIRRLITPDAGHRRHITLDNAPIPANRPYLHASGVKRRSGP